LSRCFRSNRKKDSRPGQVGTVAERLDRDTVLVEFADGDGRAWAFAPCRHNELLILHYLPEAARGAEASAAYDFG
jgi:hypothetical protein